MATTVEPPARQDTLDAIEAAEREAVLAAYQELKRRDAAELRIAIRMNKATGVREIVYIGIHEQQNLERLRRLYQQLSGRAPRRPEPVTF